MTLCSGTVNKDDKLSFRVPSELKDQLKAIAAKEGRSVAQICQAFVKAGIELYDRKGADYLRPLVGRTRSKPTS
jgi:predicted DNA-binding protein